MRKLLGGFILIDTDRNVSLETRRNNVLNLLGDGKWHLTAEINSPEVGGTEGTRRLRELRQMGHEIMKRKHAGHDDFEYGMMRV